MSFSLVMDLSDVFEVLDELVITAYFRMNSIGMELHRSPCKGGLDLFNRAASLFRSGRLSGALHCSTEQRVFFGVDA